MKGTAPALVAEMFPLNEDHLIGTAKSHEFYNPNC